MDRKTVLAVVLSILTLLIYQYFFAERPKTQETLSAKSEAQPAPAQSQPAVQPVPVPLRPSEGAAVDISSAKDIIVSTNLYEATFTEFGGRLKSFKLKKYRESLDEKSPLKELIKVNQPAYLPLGMSFPGGLLPQVEDAVFKADRYAIDLNPKKNQAVLSLAYVSPEGWQFIRKYIFYNDTYKIDLEVMFFNPTTQPVREDVSLDLINRPYDKDNGYTFTGPAAYVNDNLEEIEAKELKEDRAFNGKVSWAAYEDRYFISAIVPRVVESGYVRMSKIKENVTLTSFIHSSVVIPAQKQTTLNYHLYLGPKDLSSLKPLGLKLEKSVNFGWFDIIANPLLLTLNFFDRFTHNYGIAIILLTVLIKIIFWPLTHKSYHSMKEMQKLQPKMAKIREKYKNDKQKMNEELMGLYKTYKINPLGGCLPMVLQIPVFFALYKLLLNAIELRHAPFALWINDLSAPDRLPVGFDIPYVGGLPVLTIFMGASMFIQQKMTPTTGDPVQAKIMLLLPVIFTFLFVNFAAGLVLYWLVNNILSIGQQYYINKKTA
ncbi:MAG: membrane protein insertase YidC [Deltaproteobacteria bacterium]|nr:membrane protein insertase YidC [Deltaproteobacteria bacterium]